MGTKNPDVRRRNTLKHRYDITPEEYDAQLARQGGRCALCLGPPGSKRLHVDHDHETGVFRGLLCFSCNGALGQLGDTEAALVRVLDYLRAA